MNTNTVAHGSAAATTTPAQQLGQRMTTRVEPAPLTLSIEGLGKCYGRDAWGLRDFSLQLGLGVLGLLGPNGAGKSTLMRILATITKPTTGRVLWNGVDISKSPDVLRATLGYLPQDFGVYPNLNAVEFLTYMAAIKGLDGKTARRRIDELLQIVNLIDARKRPLGGYSGGMKQRVGIAQALLNDPQLLIVDEPTAGLDPEERARFRNLLSELSGERIVILSTVWTPGITRSAPFRPRWPVRCRRSSGMACHGHCR
jgi:ABC-2 type transport system ATP-binding protein